MRTLRGMAYRNLHLPGVVYSFKLSASGIVVLHAGRFIIKDATLTVQPAGRDRVRRTGSKVVHAGVTGTIVTDPEEAAELYAKLVAGDGTAYYNPMKTDHFLDRKGRKIEGADCVLLTQRDGRPLVKVA